MADKQGDGVGSLGSSLRDIFTGAAISFLGVTVTRLAGLGEKVLIARFFDPTRYGQVVLAVSLLSLATVIGSLGLRTGVVRYIPRQDSKDSQLGVVTASVRLTVVASVAFAGTLFFTSDVLAGVIFDDTELAPLLKIVAIGVPFAVLGQLGASVARGMKDARWKNLIENITFPISRVLLIAGAIFLGFEAVGIAWAYVGGYTLMTLLGAAYVLIVFGIPHVPNVEYTNLLRFSLPLLFANGMSFINSSLDTILIGAYLTSDKVGIYGAAYPLARLVFIPLSIVGVIYSPIISDLQSSDRPQEISKIYAIVARWVVILASPGVAMLIIEPEIFLNFVFGSDYATGSAAVVVLVIGFFYHVSLGINGSTLKMLGHSDFFLFSTVINAILNIGLNVWLIPQIGIVGAAIATTVSYAIGNSLISVRLYRDYRITPFTTENILSYLILLTIIAISYLGLNSVLNGFELVVSIYLMSISIFLIVYLRTNIPSQEERDIINEYRRKVLSSL